MKPMFPEFLDTKGSLDENSFAGYVMVLAGKGSFGLLRMTELRTGN